ncbi:hypothetical protein F3Y22_tig00110716pilonHSYRG00249 [Hibiscus syriacus]|uniref:Reverse transcriptase zinc-binding domain-containing protein n=1 Tax=Hibiscus syriacus TaxID=106335 RepID=A0A6A2ZV24_HIBSY|nr:hypothetical protein F3Y22_tig00110716pilonHSYRG00249 [Hibiscus syriacus]
MNDNGAWNLDLIFTLFPDYVASQIISIRPPILEDADCCNWRWHENFSIGNAYEVFEQNDWDPHSNHWKLIWHLPVSQRIRLFFWLPLKGKLLTNSERHKRNLANSVACPLCGSVNETVLHTLCDCTYARDIWNHAMQASPGLSIMRLAAFFPLRRPPLSVLAPSSNGPRHLRTALL